MGFPPKIEPSSPIVGPTGPAGPAGPAPVGSGNKVVATPADGSSAAAALRNLVNADLPIVSEAKGGVGSDLSVAGLGLLSRTAANTPVARTLTAPAAGLTISNPAGLAGNPTFALANDLAAIEGLASNGLVVRTGTETWTVRSMTAPAAGLSITNPDGISGSPTFALTNDLSALEGLASTGIAVRTGTDAWAQRSIAVPAAGLTITNPAGIAGNPTLALANDLAAVEGLASNGLTVRTATDTWAVRSLTAPAAGLTITNPDGVSGSPTFVLANDLAALENLGSTGIGVRTGTDAWAQRSLSSGNSITVTNPDGVSGNPAIAVTTLTSTSAPSQVGTVNLTGNNAWCIQVQGNYAYVTDLSASVFSVVDVTNPASPIQVGALTLAGQLRGLFVQGNFAYVANNSTGVLYAIDITKPSTPTLAGSLSVPNTPYGITVSGKYLYAFCDSGFGYLRIYDISVPSAMVQVGTVTVNSQTCAKIDIKGKYVYLCASTSQSIYVYDVSDPTNPTLVNTPLNVGISCISLEVSNRYLYATDSSNHLVVVDISNPASPSLVTTFTSSGSSGGIFLSGRYLFLAQVNSTIRVIDIQNPASPVQIATISSGGSTASTSPFVAGRYLYVVYATNPNKISIFDLGGLESSTIKTSNLITGKASITESLDIQGNVNISSGMSVGSGGIFCEGPIISKKVATILQAGSIDLSADQTTTSASLGDISGSTATITTSPGSKMKISVSGSLSNTTSGTTNRIALLIDGAVVKNAVFLTAAANQNFSIAIRHQASLSAGSHTIKLQWATSGGTLQARPITAAPTLEHLTLDYTELSR